LEAFANQAAVAIMNAQYFKEISESAQEMSILYEVGLAVTSGSGLDKTG
jgi:GAF domain-containing protein